MVKRETMGKEEEKAREGKRKGEKEGDSSSPLDLGFNKIV